MFVYACFRLIEGGDLKGWDFLIKILLGQGYRKQTTFRPCNVFICSSLKFSQGSRLLGTLSWFISVVSIASVSS